MSMNYGEFQRAFADGIVDRLPEDQKNANVRIGMNRKLNQRYNGLTVHHAVRPCSDIPCHGGCRDGRCWFGYGYRFHDESVRRRL